MWRLLCKVERNANHEHAIPSMLGQIMRNAQSEPDRAYLWEHMILVVQQLETIDLGPTIPVCLFTQYSACDI